MQVALLCAPAAPDAVPAGHARQTVLPRASEYDPGPHEAQKDAEVAAVTLLKVPFGHGTQSALPDDEE